MLCLATSSIVNDVCCVPVLLEDTEEIDTEDRILLTAELCTLFGGDGGRGVDETAVVVDVCDEDDTDDCEWGALLSGSAMGGVEHDTIANVEIKVMSNRLCIYIS